jgi:hypothetical protein
MIMDLLPHGLESGNHSRHLFGQMMTDQNHQHQILIQRLMYHQTCPATRRENFSLGQKIENLCMLTQMKNLYLQLFQPKR